MEEPRYDLHGEFEEVVGVFIDRARPNCGIPGLGKITEEGKLDCLKHSSFPNTLTDF